MPHHLTERWPTVTEHAQAIGYVCVLWAAMEVSLDRLLEAVAPFERGKISDSIAANVDFRDKLKVLKATAFIRKPNEKWFDDVESLANTVDNELRTERNRYVHDLWTNTVGGVAKRERKVQIKKPQARRPRELTIFTETPVKAEKIWTLAEKIQAAELTATMLTNHFRELEAMRLASLSKPP